MSIQKDKRLPYLMLQRNKTVEELLKKPDCFILLTQIAIRAKRTTDFTVNNLEIGESYIGDYKNIGLTQQRYRTAKANLQKWSFATFKATNKGTIAKLSDSRVYDINEKNNNEQSNKQITNNQQTNNEQITTNNNVINKELEELKNIPDFIDKNLLLAFFDFRESVATKKKPFTEKAKELLLKKLTNFENNKKGNANLALENAIANSWIGLFEPKDFQDQKPQTKITNKLAIELNKIIGFDLIIDTKINGYNELDIFFESKEGIQQLKDQEDKIKEKVKQKIASLKVEKYKLEVKNG